MRISLDLNDPGYRMDAHCWTVLFNGVPQTGKDSHAVVTADEERGLIVFYARDAAGNLIRHPKQMVTEHGRVVLLKMPS
jgi:hypothetical protein